MKAKKIAFLGLAIALAMIFSFVESQIPALVAMPGVKVGLPNLVMVFLLYRVGWKETVIVSIIRIFLTSLLFGNLQVLTFSIAGAVLSLTGMILLKKTGWFSCITVSIVGGLLHNIGQIVAACLWTQTAQIAFYLPVLLVSGSVAGTVIGLASGIIVKRSEKWRL
ncbi:MAG: Gx transporter family protein [Oscillospiraceae bacterium]|nr:Gx transporter family protein [Oscillospiraceae bacterium]